MFLTRNSPPTTPEISDKCNPITLGFFNDPIHNLFEPLTGQKTAATPAAIADTEDVIGLIAGVVHG